MLRADLEAAHLAEAAAAAFTRRDFPAAREQARALLLRAPRDTRAHLVLGLVALEYSDIPVAARHLNQVKAAPPTAPQALNAFGAGLFRLGDYDGARAAFICAGGRGLVDAWRNLGALERLAKNWDESIAAYKRVLTTVPKDAEAHAVLAAVYERRHDTKRAKAHAEQALAVDPNNDVAREALGRALLRERDFVGVERALAPLAQAERAAQKNRGIAWGIIGDARDQSGDAAGAFSAFTAANQLALNDNRHLLDATHLFYHPLSVQRLIERVRLATVSAWCWPDVATPSPAFLVGFPRSGTTLLDQILASHSRIVCLEERLYFSDALATAITSFAKIDNYDALTESEIAGVRTAYWTAARAETGERPDGLVVDKMPLNIVVLPMIKRIFPDAKIIFALRDPRDVILSCYQQRFGINDAMVQFLQLETAAAYYDTVMRLYEMCRERLTLSIHEVRYEEVIANLEGTARSLATFLEVEYEPGMLNYRETALRRDIDTPSARQVIQPLYTRSISRWRRYAEQLAPILPVLEPWVERFGYEPSAA